MEFLDLDQPEYRLYNSYLRLPLEKQKWQKNNVNKSNEKIHNRPNDSSEQLRDCIKRHDMTIYGIEMEKN